MDSIGRIQKRCSVYKRSRLTKKKKKKKVAPVKARKDLVVRRNNSTSFYLSEAWMRLRYRVIMTRGKKCEACNAQGSNITFHVDHIKPRSRYPELQFLESNLQVLCEACNLGKGNWDETDWREK